MDYWKSTVDLLRFNPMDEIEVPKHESASILEPKAIAT